MGGKKKSSAKSSINETSAAHRTNMANNPGISLKDAISGQIGMRDDQLGIFGGVMDQIADFGNGMMGQNPMMNAMGAMMGMPLQVDGSKLGLSEMIAKMLPEEEEETPAEQYNPADAFAHLTPEQRHAIGRYNMGGGFM